MKTILQKSITTRLLSASLSALLLIGAFGNPVEYSSSPVGSRELSYYRGTGFWSDPCTWDGFVVGTGSTLCLTGSLGACAGVLSSIWKAIKVDHCF